MAFSSPIFQLNGHTFVAVHVSSGSPVSFSSSISTVGIGVIVSLLKQSIRYCVSEDWLLLRIPRFNTSGDRVFRVGNLCTNWFTPPSLTVSVSMVWSKPVTDWNPMSIEESGDRLKYTRK